MPEHNPENSVDPLSGHYVDFPGSQLIKPMPNTEGILKTFDGYVRVLHNGIRTLKEIDLFSKKDSTEVSPIRKTTGYRNRGRRLSSRNKISRRNILGMMGVAGLTIASHSFQKAVVDNAIDTVIDRVMDIGTHKETDPEVNIKKPIIEEKAVAKAEEKKRPEIIPYSGISFGRPEMDKAASSVGITLETYFAPSIPEKVLSNLNALGEWSNDPNFKPELLPIFAPSVLHHRNLIYQLSDEFKINPNLIAAFMSIESGGNHQAVSIVGAQGLFQVMPFHFDEDFAKQKITDPAAKIRYMQNPVNNGRKGMAFFINQCLPGARRISGLDQITKNNPYDVRIIARAMMMYNAGVTGGGMNWNDLTIETQIYSEFGVLFALDAQIAQELRLSGKSNAEIVQIMSSKESDARNYAMMVHLSEFRRKFGRYYNYDDRTQLKTQLSKIVPTLSLEENYKILGPKWKDLADSYFAYITKPSFEWKTGPGGRQTINSGLAYLYSQPEVIEKNLTTNWLNPQTARP